MPKLDFNVPLLDDQGQPVLQPKTDPKRAKPHPSGQLIPHVETDADGNAIMEEVMVRQPLTRILNTVLEGDDKLPFDQRAKIGKLARKVSDRTGGSLKNYSIEELKIIQDKVAKIGSTELLVQLEELINDEPEGKGQEEAA